MTRYKAVVEYDGTLYHGWQLQPGLDTIQGKLEEVLSRLKGELVRVHGAGRTDAGVHAMGQVAHFEIDWAHTPEDLGRACNALLPKDILVRSVTSVRKDFHARHWAIAKIYKYRILNHPIRSCFWRSYAWHIRSELDLHAMNKAAGYLMGSHDFAAFGSPTDGADSTVRDISRAVWEKDLPCRLVQFTVQGSGFLRYMVRSLVGTLVMVGQNKMTPHDFGSILESCDHSMSGPTAPPTGLYLMKVLYPHFLDEV